MPYRHRRPRKFSKRRRRSPKWHLWAALGVVAFAIVAWPGPAIYRAHRRKAVREETGALVAKFMADDAEQSDAAMWTLVAYRRGDTARRLLSEIRAYRAESADKEGVDRKSDLLWRTMGPEVIDDLIDILRSDLEHLAAAEKGLEDESFSPEAARALAAVGADAVEPLRKVLATGDNIARRYSVLALGRIGDPIVFQSLADACGDTDATVRGEAVRAIAAVGGDWPARQLRWIFENKRDNTRGWAALELARGKTGDESFDLLLAALADSDADVRCAAVVAVAKSQHPRATEVLTGILKDAKSEVRRSAALALGRLEATSALLALSAMLDDPDEGVRLDVRDALLMIAYEEEIINHLAEVLKTGGPQERRTAARSLGLLDDPRGVMPLLGATADVDVEVRSEAVFSLGELGDDRATRTLGLMLFDAEAPVYRLVVEALGKIADVRATDVLIEALHDTKQKRADPELLETTIWALRSVGTEKARRAVDDYLESVLKD